MTALWTGMLLLALLAALFLIWPLFRHRQLAADLEGQQNARQLANIQLYRQKLAQLEQDLKDGRVEEAAYPEMKAEIEDLLLDDARMQQRKPWHLQGRALVVSSLLLVIATVLVGSWALYERVGGRDGLSAYVVQQQLIEEGRQDFAGLLRRLEETVHANPDDIQGWSLLARIYMDLGRLEDGAEAIGELLRIQGPNARLLAQQAQALYFQDGNRVTPRVQALIDQSTALDPGEPATLSLLGMAAYQQGNWDEARRHWEAALPKAGSLDAQASLREGIADVRERLGMEPLSGEGPQFAVTVRLSNAASLLTNPNAPVFVFAHREGSGGAPVAATRLRVADLPATVILSDEQAMLPENNLSSAGRITIQARVALSGTPQAQEGDWQGQTEVLEVDGQQQVELEINQQL